MKICGITFFIHWSFVASMIFITAFVFASVAAWEYLPLLIPIVLEWILIVMIVLFVHEAGHAMTGVLLGRHVHSVGLVAFGAITAIEDLEKASKGEQLLIFVSGPITSLAFAGAIFALWRNSEIASMSASIGLLNAVPIYPLDGGRMMYIALRRLPQKLIPLITGSVSCVSCLLVMVLLIHFEDFLSAAMVFIVHVIGLTVLVNDLRKQKALSSHEAQFESHSDERE